jgi:UDP-3-O-[3-hydroxymyristoyl] glucosamine N-acyltransferase
MKLKEIASRVNGTLSGDGETEISGIAAITEAQPGEITFLSSRSYEKFLPDCHASAVVVGADIDASLLGGRNVVVVRNPALSQIDVAELFQQPMDAKKGVAPGAYVAPTATVSAGAAVLPYAYIDEGAIVEKDAVIHPFCFVGRGARVGEGTILYPRVTLYEGTVIGKRVIVHSGTVLGCDGFGYVWDGARHRKIPQLGILEIEDDVEIGANSCIDRASLHKTVIGKGTRIDNLVQVAHNVTIGENSILVSQVGIAGSTSVGRNVILAGKVGVADHVTIGDNVRAAGGTGITKSVKSNSTVGGNPHMGQRDWLKMQTYLRRLPDLFERIRRIEASLFPKADNDRN